MCVCRRRLLTVLASRVLVDDQLRRSSRAMRSSFVVLALVLCGVFAVAVQAQAPIPYRPDGWQIGGPITAPIVVRNTHTHTHTRKY